MPRRILSFGYGLIISISASVCIWAGTQMTLPFLEFKDDSGTQLQAYGGVTATHLLLFIIAALLLGNIFIFTKNSVRTKESTSISRFSRFYSTVVEILSACLLAFAVISILFAFPAMMLYWMFNPDVPKRAIEIAVIFLSIGISIVFYFRNKHKLLSPADKITFFSGVLIGPITLIHFLL